MAAFPTVDLVAPTAPKDGIMVFAPPECRKFFARDSRCRQHYESLRTSEGIFQCPFGFASLAVRRLGIAFTAVIPHPRLGGKQERLRAKLRPQNKVLQTALERAGIGLISADERILEAETEAVRKQTVALHEIRKLNRTVKQTAERLCKEDSPQDIDNAAPPLVRILKTAELMSYQFEILELLANESLVDLPLQTDSEIYRLIDKVVRIYRPENQPERISLRASGPSPTVRVCDKTFSIIPTVLIENALKHSPKGSRIVVDVRSDGTGCVISVSSYAAGNLVISDELFAKGIRGTTLVEGSGHGLHLAQLVARQHGTVISVTAESLTPQTQRITFALGLRIIQT